MSGPLHGTRVLEVAGGVASAYCGALLGDLGASVLVVDDSQSPSSFRSDRRVFAEGLRRTLDRNKHWLHQHEPSTWSELLAWADVIITEGTPGQLDSLADPEQLRHLVVVAISDFGLTGPHLGWSGSDLVDSAYGGGCQPNGEPGRPPLRAPAYVGDHEVGVGAAVAALLGLLAARRDGVGQVADVSGVDAWATMQTAVGLLEFIFQGRVATRHGRRFGTRYPYTTLPCSDGEVRLIAVVGREWKRALAMMGDPDWAKDPRFADRRRNQTEHADELDDLIGAWLASRKREEVLNLALEFAVPWAPVLRIDEVLLEPQLLERGYVWDDGTCRIPGFPAIFSRTPAELGTPIPEAPDTAQPKAVQRSPGWSTSSQPPLESIRVIDLSWAWAGGAVGSVLADFGADVIKVESARRLDPMRMDRPLLGGDSGVEQGGLHHNVNRNKRSIAVDISQPDGANLVRQLAMRSDVLLTNFSPGTLEDHGLGYSSLAAANPKLIYLTNTGTGSSGRLASLRAYAPVITALSGVDSLTGYEKERPLGLQHGIADPNAALHAALTVLAALIEREESGVGQSIDLSQLECMVSLIGAHLVAAQLDPETCVGRPFGNRDPLLAPCGVYPAAGQDKWLALACPNNAAWPALANLIRRPQWSSDPAFATAEDRSERADAIDEAIASWCITLDYWDAATAAQAAGQAAGPLLDTADRFADSHLWAREDFAGVEHPVVGAEFVYGLPWKLSRTPGAVTRAAPILGADTRDVLRSVIGKSDEEIDALEAAGVLQ